MLLYSRVGFWPCATDKVHPCTAVRHPLLQILRLCLLHLFLRFNVDLILPSTHVHPELPHNRTANRCFLFLLLSYYVGLTLPSAHELPEPPHNRIANLTPFQRLLFIRCLQPRALMPAAKVCWGGGGSWGGGACIVQWLLACLACKDALQAHKSRVSYNSSQYERN